MCVNVYECVWVRVSACVCVCVCSACVCCVYVFVLCVLCVVYMQERDVNGCILGY